MREASKRGKIALEEAFNDFIEIFPNSHVYKGRGWNYYVAVCGEFEGKYYDITFMQLGEGYSSKIEVSSVTDDRGFFLGLLKNEFLEVY